MQVLWQGHEVDAYKISNSSDNIENVNVREPAYERAGMLVGRSALGDLESQPDWPARAEIWHCFHWQNDNFTPVGIVIWAARNAAGANVAQIITITDGAAPTAQYQALVGGVMTNVGAAFVLQGAGLMVTFDVHHNGANGGKIEVWYGSIGAQAKVLDAAGDFSGAAGIVRIYHDCTSANLGYNTYVSQEIVQTASTLSSTSEIKPPTSNGADVGGTGTWADVDELVFSDADTVSFAAAGDRQSFKAAARLHTQAVVSGVTASCRAWYEAGGPTSIKPYLTIAGVRYYGTTFALDVIAAAYQYTWQINPATGVAFTTAEGNDANLEWGWEAVA